MRCTWSYFKVSQFLDLDVTPDLESRRAGQAVRLGFKLANRSEEEFYLPAPLLNRSAHILFMERVGRGFFLIPLSSLFKRKRQLLIPPGKRLGASVSLEGKSVSESTRVLHFDLPPDVRTFQVFLPLSDEEPDGFRYMTCVNTEGVDVADSWVH